MLAVTKRNISRWRKALYALVCTIATFAILEFTLMVVGLQPESQTEDPLVGFSQFVPLMEEVRQAGDASLMVTRTSKLVWFNPQVFPKQKSDKVRRIFCLGGSTTYGRPYSDPTSFCGWLRELLPVVDGSVRWEVINAGGISYASYRVAAVMRELAAYEPDLFVVYTGHNEFLEKRTYASLAERGRWRNELQALAASSRTYTLLERLIPWRADASQSAQTEWLSAEVDERLNHTIGPRDYIRDPEWAANVVHHFELNVRRMIAIARDAGAEILFVVPSANEMDCSPFKSQLTSQSLDASESQSSFDLLNEDVSVSVESADVGTADGQDPVQLREKAEDLQKVVMRDPLNADLHYRLGRIQFALSEFDEAKLSFRKAINQDICPLRATDQILQIVKQVCKSESVAYVDFDRRLQDLSQREQGHPILGQAYFLDHVHPTIDVHFRLAEWIMEAMQAANLLAKVDLSHPELRVDFQTCRERVLSQVDQREHGIALRNLAKVLHWSGKFQLAADRASDALELLGSDAESRFVLADSLKNCGEPDRAQIQYQLLMQDHPEYARAYLPFGELLVSQGETESGLDLLLSAVIYEPENVYAHLQLGKLYLQQGEWRLAAEALAEAERLDPDSGEIRRMLDMSLQGLQSVARPTLE